MLIDNSSRSNEIWQGLSSERSMIHYQDTLLEFGTDHPIVRSVSVLVNLVCLYWNKLGQSYKKKTGFPSHAYLLSNQLGELLIHDLYLYKIKDVD
jgi:hypothetical protein